MPLSLPPYVALGQGRFVLSGTNYYQLPGVTTLSTTTATLTGGTLVYCPIKVEKTITVDQIALEVTSLVSGNQARVGIYNADGTWQPTTLVVDGGLIDTGTNGVKTASISATLTSGFYLLAFHSNNSSTGFRIFRSNTLSQIHVNLGSSPWIGRLSKATAFAPLANPGVAWDTIGTTNAGGLEYWCVLRLTAA